MMASAQMAERLDGLAGHPVGREVACRMLQHLAADAANQEPLGQGRF